MTLIKSISGIRGTIGGKAGQGLSPVDIVRYTAAYGEWIKSKNKIVGKLKVVVGRDARISGEMLNHLVKGTLVGMGIDVIDIGLASTPSTEMAVTEFHANGGLILTASHNPRQWNALKLLNGNGEFLDSTEGEHVLEIADANDFVFSDVNGLGEITEVNDYIKTHIEHILNLKLVDVDAIREANFSVVFDGINSVGGIILPELFEALGVRHVMGINTEPDGEFAHTPEPLPENLSQISELVVAQKADVGFVVDPDVDRLAIINEDGTMFGEEYTLVSVADYVLSKEKGNTVSNLSSTRALREVTEKHGGTYYAAAVGEVNVVNQMKEVGAIIGGEGNGGVIYPEIHYGRDALVGIALFLTHLAYSELKCSELRAKYPNYYISKNKIELTEDIDVDKILQQIKKKYQSENINEIDGIKIDFADEWVHLRKSNTEPIIRIYSESRSKEQANALAERMIGEIEKIVNR